MKRPFSAKRHTLTITDNSMSPISIKDASIAKSFTHGPHPEAPADTSRTPIPGFKPEILAPAGDRAALMAAFAAGADAVYLGLKHFSARMQAENFSVKELAMLTDMARSENKRIHVALNTLLKPNDIYAAGRLMDRLAREVKPHALILQDLGAVELAKQAGFEGDVHLSTLANISSPSDLAAAAALGARCVVLPRELTIDEIRAMSEACPDGLALEVFIHGALCYCVSGRCYWSSYMGGKSGLRGRCVQPCRRMYTQKNREARFFSCRDLSLDVLVKTLLSVPRVTTWKIEGRKKGPHYVYYTTAAYVLLRDNPDDAQAKKTAEELLGMALGRPSTRARFLPQRILAPTAPDDQTSSGLLVGKIMIDNAVKNATIKGHSKTSGPGKGKKNSSRHGSEAVPAPRFSIKPRQAMLPGDLLRVGYEDEPWHYTLPVTRHIPKAGTFTLMLPHGKRPKSGTPVFLIDRKEPELNAAIREWEQKFEHTARAGQKKTGLETDFSSDFSPTLPGRGPRVPVRNIILRSAIPHGKEGKTGIRSNTLNGLWLSPRTLEVVSRTIFAKISWWLPPAIWPDEQDNWQEMVRRAIKQGAKQFVCNQPWQITLFNGVRLPPQKSADFHEPVKNKRSVTPENLELLAGPFCNTANVLSLESLRRMGFCGAFISPELSGEDMLALPASSPLPLGIVLSGFWPVGISRFEADGVRLQEALLSPKRELFWTRRYGQNLWLYPGWPIDLSARREELERAGYSWFVRIEERLPKDTPEPTRTTEFNWSLDLL